MSIQKTWAYKVNYCTYTDLVERFGPLELDQLTNHAGDCPKIQSAIADASSEIDVYLASRYILPLTPPIPIALKRCACDIARYYLWDTQTTDHVRERHQDAMGLLKSLGSGDAVLEVAVPPEPTSSLVKFSQENRNVWQQNWDNYGCKSSSIW